MPANNQPFQVHLPERKINPHQHNKVGAVIKFVGGADELARVQAFLDRLVERGIIEPVQAQTFNSEMGTPVWYIP